MNAVLRTSPQFLRLPIARGIATDGGVQRDGGDHNAGIIRGLAVITRGEALTKGQWIDLDFLRQTESAINATTHGVKARFAHPGLSGDGLGKFLGRVKDGRLDGNVERADLHFSKSAHKTPDGDLAGYVMDLAEQDPAAFGASIAFRADEGAEKMHQRQHSDKTGRFTSPDEMNTDNLPHLRLAALRAIDAVDQPAANPDGLFGTGQEIAIEADALLSYALGLTDVCPELVELSIDPDRATGFVRRFLDERGLEIVPKRAECLSLREQLEAHIL